jgi:hypothetical protein
MAWRDSFDASPRSWPPYVARVFPNYVERLGNGRPTAPAARAIGRNFGNDGWKGTVYGRFLARLKKFAHLPSP